MKKKILCILLIAVAVVAFGCGKTTLSYVEDNMAEITKTFYFGENKTLYATLSSGQRENEYLLNGKAEPLVDFALLSVTFFEEAVANVITVEVSVNETKQTIELELNRMSGAYMADLERFFTGEETIIVEYNGEQLQLNNLSKDFKVQWKEALEIAVEQLQSEITKEKEYANLNAECYLKVLDKRANNFEEFFWCFTILNVKNESFSVVISTTDGSVLAKTK